jgi:hypothetical protein
MREGDSDRVEHRPISGYVAARVPIIGIFPRLANIVTNGRVKDPHAPQRGVPHCRRDIRFHELRQICICTELVNIR